MIELHKWSVQLGTLTDFLQFWLPDRGLLAVDLSLGAPSALGAVCAALGAAPGAPDLLPSAGRRHDAALEVGAADQEQHTHGTRPTHTRTSLVKKGNLNVSFLPSNVLSFLLSLPVGMTSFRCKEKANNQIRKGIKRHLGTRFASL